MKEIPLTQGFFAQVDDEDYDYLSQWKWTASKSNSGFYATRWVCLNKKSIIIRMHRIILNRDNNLLIDHIDHNSLNNQKLNLRICNVSQNHANRRKKKDASSRFFGVYINNHGSIVAELRKNNRKIYLGCFKTEELAAIAYNEAAIKYHGEFANLNIID